MEAEREHVLRIANQQARLVLEAFAFGRTLHNERDLLGHVRFYRLVEVEFFMSRRSAENYIELVDKFGDMQAIVSYLPLRLLQQISTPKTPADFRVKVRELLRQGKRPASSELAILLISARAEADDIRRTERKRLKRRRSLAWKPRTARAKSPDANPTSVTE